MNNLPQESDWIQHLPTIRPALELAIRSWLEAENSLDNAQRGGTMADVINWDATRLNRLRKVIDLGKPRIYEQ